MRPSEVSRGSIFAALAFAFSCFCLILFFWIQFGGSVPLKAQGYRFAGLVRGGAEHDPRGGRADLGRVGRQGGGRRALRPAHRRDRRARLALRADPRRHTRDRAVQDAAGGGVRGALARRPQGAQAGRRRAPVRAPGGPHAGARPGAERVRRAHPRSRCGASCPSSPWPSTAAARTSTPRSGMPSRARRTSTAWSGVLDLQRAEVRGLVRDSATVLAAVGRREGDLQGLVTAGNDVLSTTAARNRELTETVRALPGFLVDLRGSLRRLDRAGAKVAPDVRTLRSARSPPERLAHGARRAHARVRRVLRGAAPRDARGRPRPARRHRHLQGDASRCSASSTPPAASWARSSPTSTRTPRTR